MKQNNSSALRMSDKQAFAAVRKGDAAKLAIRLDKGVSVNAVGDLLPFHSQVPLVVVAAREGSPECVQLLLSRGADPNARAISHGRTEEGLPGMTALVAALREHGDPDATEKQRRREVANLLLKAGADPDAICGDDELPMKWAIWHDYEGVPEELISAGAKAHLNPRYGILNEAARWGSIRYLKQFFAAGMSPNATNKHAAPPLFSAAHAAHPEVVDFLLKSGAEPDPVMRRGWTPLHVACDHASRSGLNDQFQADLAIISMLLRHGADINRRTPDGETPLALAMKGGSAKPVVALLQSHGASL